MFSEAFVLDGKEFRERSSLAFYLKKNFKKSLTYLSDDTIFMFLKKELPELYEHILELSKDFEHKENILTLIIYLLDNTQGIATPNYQFKTNYDIADVMKKDYPNVNQDIRVLFNDKVLAHIFWNEFNKNFDSRYKRNYTFMLHVYENRMYSFTYFYYLFLHLSKNETVRFTFDGLKMKTVAEITNHLANNIDRAQILIDEILNNPYVLALMAIESGIETVSNTLSSNRSLEILKLLATYQDVDLTPIIKRKMAYWLVNNYNNYTYETDEAKLLYNDYLKLSKNLTLNTLSDYISIYDVVNDLYKRFVSLFNHNKFFTFRNGVSAKEEYYLNYRLNDDYVCKQFLIDNSLYDPTIHTAVHNDSVEREVIVDALEKEKSEIIKFKEEVLALTANLTFNSKLLKQKLFISVMYLLQAIASLCGGLLLGISNENQITEMIKYGLLILSSISIVFLFICVVKYSKKLADAELVELAAYNSTVSIEAICKEEQYVLNPNNKKFKLLTLTNSKIFSKNRRKDLVKIKKISTKKTTVSNGLLVLSTIIALLPILEFGLVAVLGLFNLTPYVIYLNNIEINLISLGLFLVNFILVICFRKKRFAYYLIYLYMIILAVLSYIIV